MIYYFYNMIHSVAHKNITWLDITNPKPKDIKYLQENFNFHELVLEELIPPGHRPKVEHHEGYIFLILYYPAFNRAKKETFPRELDIIVTENHIITSHYETIVPVKSLFDQLTKHTEVRDEYMSETTGHLLYDIIKAILENAMNKLENIEEEVDYIEEKIFSGKEKEMVFEISVAKRDIIDFRRIMAPQASIIDSLVSEGTIFFGEDLQPHFEDLRGTFGIVWNELQDHRETIDALAQTNESLLSTKTNEIIKVLAMFSVVFLPLTLIASIWGMNIEELPLVGGGRDFYMILGIMVFSAVAMVSYFKYKKWV